LLIMLALLSLGITMWPAARSLGCHMMMAIGLFFLVVHDLWREPTRSDALIHHTNQAHPAFRGRRDQQFDQRANPGDIPN
jgi:hypothetical protein